METETPTGEIVRNPYELADEALRVWIARDAAGAERLLGQPPAADAFAVGLTDEDEVQGLFFEALRSRRIHAVVRTADGEEPAVWFAIERSLGGFRLVEVASGDANPPMEYHVEGG